MRKIEKLVLWIVGVIFAGMLMNALVEGASRFTYWAFYQQQVEQTIRDTVKPEALR